MCTAICDLVSALLNPGIGDPARHTSIALLWVGVLSWLLTFQREAGSSSIQLRDAVAPMIRGSSVHSLLNSLASKAREVEFRSGSFSGNAGVAGNGMRMRLQGPTSTGPTCHFCKHPGHISRDCPQKLSRGGGGGGGGGAPGGGGGRQTGFAALMAPGAKFTGNS